MHFDSLSDFLAMGGHALYVWLAYGSTVIVLLANVAILRSARVKQWRRLQWQVRSESAVGQSESSLPNDTGDV